MEAADRHQQQQQESEKKEAGLCHEEFSRTNFVELQYMYI